MEVVHYVKPIFMLPTEPNGTQWTGEINGEMHRTQITILVKQERESERERERER